MNIQTSSAPQSSSASEWFFFEYTDTYGGEANYSWVKRFKVKAKSLQGALIKVSREIGAQGLLRRDWDDGTCTRWSVRGSATCIFGQYWEDEQHSQNLFVKELP